MSDSQRIEQICIRFEDDWKQCQDQRPRVEDYLADFPSSNRAQLIQLLLEIELEYLHQLGDVPSRRSLLDRFPQHETLVLRTLQIVRQRCHIEVPEDTHAKSNPMVNAGATTQMMQGVLNSASAQDYCEFDASGNVVQSDHSDWIREVDQAFRPGMILDERYELQGVIGQGGMGTVLLAQDQQLDRQVAVKIVQLGRLNNDPERRLNLALREEARMGASLNDPAIATVLDYGTHADRDYVVFEYVEGQTLLEILEDKKRLPLKEVRQLSWELARALDVAHGQGIVHHDLKPANIAFRSPSEPRILDFGIAHDLRRRVSGARAGGTPLYAAPEQALQKETRPQTDQYALALVMYEMLSGQFAFDGKTANEVLLARLNEDPTPLSELCPDIPESVSDAVAKALSREIHNRFPSCREFILAAFPQLNSISNEAIRITFGGPCDVFIGTVSADSVIAAEVSSLLDQHGLSSWRYQRDAIPGVPFLKQVTAAIHRSTAAVLLISEASVRSEDFGRQIRCIDESNCPAILLLLGITMDDLNRRAVSWRTLLPSAQFIEIPAGRWQHAELQLLQALTRVGCNPTAAARPGPRTRSEPAPQLTRHQPWETDSSQIDIEELPRLIFRTRLVEQFLTSRNCYFLSGTKGLGKTMLLSCKRHLLLQNPSGLDDAEGLCLIPQKGAYLDLMSSMRMVSEHFETTLSALAETRRMWSTALRISAISHHSSIIHAEDRAEIQQFPAPFQGWLQGTQVSPTVVFKKLTNLTVKQMNQLLTNRESFLDEKLRAIQSATYFFIDKVDQAVQERSRAAWVNIQAGLIEAAWEIMNANRHVRVYATIRQEAFANYHSAIKANVRGSTLELRYTDDELKSMMDGLSSSYEDNRQFLDFAGLHVIKHPGRPVPEDAFRFLRRHTLGRPRDLVTIAKELSHSGVTASEEQYVNVVRRCSASSLVNDIFEEMRVFLDCLADEDERQRFFRCLPANILDRREAFTVCARFNGIDEAAIQSFGPDSQEIFHPFGDLYLCGLLGIISVDPETRIAVQRFRRPDDPLRFIGADLPNSDWYLLHPAFSVWLQEHQLNPDFFHQPTVATGEHLPWETWDPICCEIARLAVRLRDQELRTFVHRVAITARSHLKSSTPGNLRYRLKSDFDWAANLTKLTRTGHEDLALWLEELACVKAIIPLS